MTISYPDLIHFPKDYLRMNDSFIRVSHPAPLAGIPCQHEYRIDTNQRYINSTLVVEPVLDRNLAARIVRWQGAKGVDALQRPCRRDVE